MEVEHAEMLRAKYAEAVVRDRAVIAKDVVLTVRQGVCLLLVIH